MKKDTKPPGMVRKGKPKAVAKKTPWFKAEYLWLIGIIVLAFIAFYPAHDKEFINFDDDNYITNNPQLQNFSLASIPSVFTHYYDMQYSPLQTTFLGLLSMVNGFNPRLFNLASMLMHLVNILLVYLFIRRLTGKGILALITAALFGLATMQAESVSWCASAFKTCTYSMFFLLSLIVYLKYIEKDKLKHLIISLVLFVCACLSKEQAVSLSLAVVAVDYFKGRKLLSRKVILEKAPFFLVSLVFGIVTLLATRSGKEIVATDYSFIERLSYISYAFILYIVKLFAPFKMSLFYPYPAFGYTSVLFYLFPLMTLALVTLMIVAIRKRNVWLGFGSLFFLLNIAFSLTLQIIAVRATFMADRYVYLASIGIFFMAAYGIGRLLETKKIRPAALYSVLITFILLTAWLTRERASLWKNSGTIMSDVVSKYDFDAAYLNLGIWDQQHKDLQKAMEDYNNALRVNPKMPLAWLNRGCLYIDLGNDSMAIANINKAEELNPKLDNIYSIRGGIYSRLKKYFLALKDFNEALRRNPRSELAYLNRGITYQSLSLWQKALDDYNALLELRPDASQVYAERGRMKHKLNMHREAMDDYNKAIQLDPNQGSFYLNRSYGYLSLNENEKALQDARTASAMGAKVDPRYIEYLENKMKNH